MSLDTWLRVDEKGTMSVISMGEEPSLEQMQEAVGGYIERMPVVKGARFPAHGENGPVWGDVITVYANEDGRLHGMGVNQVGTCAVFSCAYNDAPTPIVGPVLIQMRTSSNSEQCEFGDFLKMCAGEDIFTKSHMLPSPVLYEGVYE